MHFSTFLAAALPVLATVATLNQSTPFNGSEYYSLGCPNSTKPFASQQEQLQAITNFDNLLVQKQFKAAYNTYAATNFISHVARIPGNGTALAIQYLVPALANTTLTILDVWVGLNAQGDVKSTTYFKGNSQARGLGVIVDFWRMIGTCLVETWEVGAPVTNSTNPIAYF
ncbi:MAG: hypothetical protein LQ346_001750 [Caloplaca aetnensis]|nr:MAG: hypothetical protein LQ346_001750 [Caloplaca aetnensis]